jgi:hypothetical protein
VSESENQDHKPTGHNADSQATAQLLEALAAERAREQALLQHYDEYIGARNDILICQREPGLHLDTYTFKPTQGRPYITLATVGMSARKMNTPEEFVHLNRVELITYVEPAWDFDSPLGQLPFHILMASAEYPFRHNTWLSYDHTIAADGRPQVPGSLLTVPYFRAPPEEDGFHHLDFPDGSSCHFLWDLQITDAELYVKATQGVEELDRRLDEAQVHVLDIDRPCLVSTENRAQRRAREKARRLRARVPRVRTVQQVQCQLHDHCGDAPDGKA